MTRRCDVAASASAPLRPRWSEASGKAPIRGLIGLLITAGLIYGGVKLLPVRWGAFAFDEAVREEVVFAGGRRRPSDQTITRNLIDRAQELGLPVVPGNIKISRPGRNIIVEVNYTVRLEFIGGFVYDWRFSPRHQGPLIF